jgi:hypothetical protein
MLAWRVMCSFNASCQQPACLCIAPTQVQLIGRRRLSYYSSACMYASHPASVMCDYCVPSTCIRSLLRLMDHPGAADARPDLHAAGAGAAAASSDAPQRFIAAGGLYAIFLLLHHELCGSHHSKMASSLVSLLNLVLASEPRIQVREVAQEVLQPHGTPTSCPSASTSG